MSKQDFIQSIDERIPRGTAGRERLMLGLQKLTKSELFALDDAVELLTRCTFCSAACVRHNADDCEARRHVGGS